MREHVAGVDVLLHGGISGDGNIGSGDGSVVVAVLREDRRVGAVGIEVGVHADGVLESSPS